MRLIGDGERTMSLTPAMVRSFGLRTTQARSSEARPELVLFGSLFIDPSRMVRVHSRFSGEVIAIGQITPSVKEDGAESAAGGPGVAALPDKPRPLRAGDSVRKGDLLAIVLSKDVGEKKSDLVDALSQLYLDRANIDRLHKLEEGIVPKRQVREAEHKFEADQIAVDTIERTLRSWRLTEKEINDVRAEAEKLHKDQRGHDPSLGKTWAEVDVKAPFDAVILEKNATVGDIVDTNLDLFKLADLTTLGVWADAYEEDLPAIEAIPADQRNWMIHVEADPRPPFRARSTRSGRSSSPRITRPRSSVG